MSQRRDARAFKVGLFTLVALSLFLGALFALGAGVLRRERIRVETYFAESVHGLSVGSPVKLRGVQIGSVEEITFTRISHPLDPSDPDSDEWSKKVMVLAALDPDAFPESRTLNVEALIQDQIAQGLRLQLALEGISGLLYLEANYWPEDTSQVAPPWKPEHYFVPPRSSTFTQLATAMSGLFDKVDAIDVAGFAGDVKTLLSSANAVLAGIDAAALQADASALLADLRESTALLRDMLAEADRSGLIGRTSSTLDDVAKVLSTADQGVRETLADVRSLVRRLEDLLNGDAVQNTLANLERSSSNLPGVLTRLDLLLSDQSGELALLVRHLNSVSAKVDDLLAGLRGQPARALFGAPPPPSRPFER